MRCVHTVLLAGLSSASLPLWQVPCGTKNDQIIQVVTYSYEPFASILNIPREETPAPMKAYEVF